MDQKGMDKLSRVFGAPCHILTRDLSSRRQETQNGDDAFYAAMPINEINNVEKRTLLILSSASINKTL